MGPSSETVFASIAAFRPPPPHARYNGSAEEVSELVNAFGAIGTTAAAALVLLYLAGLFVAVQGRLDVGETRVGRAVAVLVATAAAAAFALRDAARDAAAAAASAPASASASLSAKGKDGAAVASSHPRPANRDPLAHLSTHGLRHLAVIMDGNRRFGRACVASIAATTAASSTGLGGGVDTAAASSFLSSAVAGCSGLAEGAGHKAGGEALMRFIVWCIEHEVPMLTVYAFSTENWSRSAIEVDFLMRLFESYFARIRIEARAQRMRIRFVSTEPERLPSRVLALMRAVEEETGALFAFPEALRRSADGAPPVAAASGDTRAPAAIVVNVCVSYGARSEIAAACRGVARRVARGELRADDVGECDVEAELLRGVTWDAPAAANAAKEASAAADGSGGAADGLAADAAIGDGDGRRRDIADGWRGAWASPDALLRTSGEQRLSNFLLYQCAYSELCFVDKPWPAVGREDLRAVIAEFRRRTRRFGA